MFYLPLNSTFILKDLIMIRKQYLGMCSLWGFIGHVVGKECLYLLGLICFVIELSCVYFGVQHMAYFRGSVFQKFKVIRELFCTSFIVLWFLCVCYDFLF